MLKITHIVRERDRTEPGGIYNSSRAQAFKSSATKPSTREVLHPHCAGSPVAETMLMFTKDYISQLSLQLGCIMGLGTGQSEVSRHDVSTPRADT